MSLLASVVWPRSGVRRRDDWTETCRAAVDGLGRRTASGYAGNWDDGPRNRTEAETHADRRVRPNAPPEEKDIGTAALRLIRDDCQAGSVRVPDGAGHRSCGLVLLLTHFGHPVSSIFYLAPTGH